MSSILLFIGMTWLGLGVPETVHAKVPKSSFEISLTLEKYRAERSGGMSILSGTIGPGEANISVIVEPDKPHAPGATWRDRFLARVKKDHEVTDFDVDGIACAEYTMEMGPFSMMNWNAYPTAAGYSFDIHVSATVIGGKTAFDRAAFTKIVQSFAVDALRRGERDDYPKAMQELLRRAWRAAPDGLALLKKERQAKPKDVYAAIALGEYVVIQEEKAAFDDAESAYDAVRSLAAASSATSREKSFMTALAEDGLAYMFVSANEKDEAREHVAKIYPAAKDASVPAQAAFAMSAAIYSAAFGNADQAATYLEKAILHDPSMRARAKKAKIFQSLLDNPKLAAVLEGTAASQPSK